MFSSSFAPKGVSIVSGSGPSGSSGNPFSSGKPARPAPGPGPSAARPNGNVHPARAAQVPRDSAHASPSSAQASAGPSEKQRKKRPRESGASGSGAAAYEKRDRVKAGEVNLEKLMRRVSGRPEQAGDDGPEESAAAGTAESPRATPSKKRKTKAVPVGLDGRPLRQSVGTPDSKRGNPVSGTPAKDAASETPSSSKKPKAGASPAPATARAPAPAASVPLTTLQSKLTQKLESAKFRWLNEQLYTRPSGEAAELMRGAQEGKDGAGSAFDEYHASHRHQTAHWPSPPLEHITTALRALPSTTPSGDSWLIIDLGCGDAGLAKALSADNKGKRVLSFDLVGDIEARATPSGAEGWVVPIDFLTRIPLPGDPGGRPGEGGAEAPAVVGSSGSSKKRKRAAKRDGAAANVAGRAEVVDVAVCCLSLMGTNWVGGVYEACRVLRQGGLLYIAEVTSRLVSTEGFIDTITSFGFELEEHTSPTTHFDLFTFRKASAFPLGAVAGQAGWDARIEAGQKVLKGCVYKKR